MIKKCPKCGSTSVDRTHNGLYCKKCGFINKQGDTKVSKNWKIT